MGRIDRRSSNSRGTGVSRISLSPALRANPASQISSFNAIGLGGTRATFTFGSGNSSLRVRADKSGTAGNVVRIRFVNPGGTAARSITVAGNDITVNLAVTGGVVDATETALNIRNAINGNAAAAALVTADLPTGDGSGAVAPAAYTSLAGGGGGVSSGLNPGPHPAEAYG